MGLGTPLTLSGVLGSGSGARAPETGRTSGYSPCCRRHFCDDETSRFQSGRGRSCRSIGGSVGSPFPFRHPLRPSRDRSRVFLPVHRGLSRTTLPLQIPPTTQSGPVAWRRVREWA